MFTDRSEGAMTELVDKVAGHLVEGYADMDKFQQRNVKETLLPVIVTCIDVLDAEHHQPKRNDEVATWIKQARDHWREGRDEEWTALDNLLDDYRERADTGRTLTDD